jgi:5-hydroxyisourate hydrolase
VSQLTTHVLDTARGRPAEGVHVELRSDGVPIATAATDADGRVSELGPERLDDGVYALRFDTASYFQAQGLKDRDFFHPEIVVTFRVAGGDHYHVPLLLSPYAYSTYRGS